MSNEIRSFEPIGKDEIIKHIKAGMPISIHPSIRKTLRETSIKEVYLDKFPKDELGKELRDISFEEVFDALNNHEDVYKVIGVNDSFVREALFAQLSLLTKLDYDCFYELWLYKG